MGMAAILDMSNIGQVLTEKMFENNVIHVNIAPGQGQTITWCQFLFKNVNLLSIWSFAASFSQSMTVKVYPIQTHRRPFDPVEKRSRSTYGYHLYKLCRACIPKAACQVSRSYDF